jgi:hypothetical protein
MAAHRFSLFESLMIGRELEQAVKVLSKRINEGADPSHAAARLAERYNVEVRDLVACYKNRYITHKLNEAPLDDAIEDLKSEGLDALDEIAADYGLNPQDLYNAYQRKVSRQADPEVQRRGQERASQERETERAEKEMRKAAGKKAFASKIANMVDRYAEFYGVSPSQAVWAVAEKLRDQKLKLDAGDVDDYYFQARGQMPSTTKNVMGSDYSDRVKADVVQIMQDAAAMQFPDGDPMDAAIPKIERKYGDEVAMDASKIYTEHTGQPFQDYLADMWDQIAADSPNVLPTGMDNPWR